MVGRRIGWWNLTLIWAVIVPSVGMAIVLVLFLVYEHALNSSLSGVPGSPSSFSRLCKGDSAFSEVDPYRGPGPHPIAVFDVGDIDPAVFDARPTDPVYTGGLPQGELAGKVQLVGCARRIGRVSPNPIYSCSYEGGYTVTVYQARYRVDVYEARTGRAVRSVTVDGAPTGCGHFISVRPDSSKQHWDSEDEPLAPEYATALSELVSGNAGG